MTMTNPETTTSFTAYTERSAYSCWPFLHTVRHYTDRMVWVDPDNIPTSFTYGARHDLRNMTAGPLHARLSDEVNGAVELILDSHDPLAAGVDTYRPDDDDPTSARMMLVDVSNLVKIPVFDMQEVQTEIVEFPAHEDGLRGALRFDTWVVLEDSALVRGVLPPEFMEWVIRDQPNTTRYTFKASVRALGDNVYELTLLLGGRASSPTVTLGEQYLLGRNQGPAYGWPVYATYDRELPTALPIERGKVYAAWGERAALVLTEADNAGRHRVAYLDDPMSVFGRLHRRDLLPLSEGQEAQRDDWASPLMDAVLRLNEASDQLTARVAEITKESDDRLAAHEADIKKISDRFIQEAEDRDWCSEYDSVISDLNGQLNIPLEDRKYEYEVRVRVTSYVDVTVEARSRDEAEEMVDNDRDLVTDRMDDDDIDSVVVIEVSRA